MYSNYSLTPLVTAQLMTHSGDLEYLHRSLGSVKEQILPADLMDVQILFDGTPTSKELDSIEAETKGLKCPATLLATGEKSGYYCVPRNMALPSVRGHYIAHLDADNEWSPSHLSGLLEAIRIPHTTEGWPHFVYSRRRYVRDKDCTNETLPEGPTSLVTWDAISITVLLKGPQGNFIDTSDFLIGKSVLYELAERQGIVWNPQMRRYGDWELITRLAKAGFRGKAVDQVTNIYHWTGKNLQTTRLPSEIVAIPESIYLDYKERGLIRD